MSDLENTIHQALTGEYWSRTGYSTRRMAEAAAKAAGRPDADLLELETIIVRNLEKPSFVTMAREITEALKPLTKQQRRDALFQQMMDYENSDPRVSEGEFRDTVQRLYDQIRTLDYEIKLERAAA